MKAILITGHAREGKTTLAEKLSNKFHVPNYALADELKIVVDKLFDIFQKEKPRCKEDMRYYYQQIGTEICRGTFGEDVWCSILFNKIKYNECAIISDIRFQNELNYFKDRFNCILIRVYDPNMSEKDVLHHSSELQIDSLTPDFVYTRGKTTNEEMYAYIQNFLDS